MILVLHLDVVLGEAERAVLLKELAVTAVKDVHLRIGEFWVLEVVDRPVLVANELGHARCTVDRVFAVEDEEGVWWVGLLEKLFCQKRLVVVVDGTFNVATLVLVLETAVDDHDFVVVGIVVTVEYADQSVLLDAGKTIVCFGRSVRKLVLMHSVDIIGRLQRWHWRRIVFAVPHDIVRVLEHAQ